MSETLPLPRDGQRPAATVLLAAALLASPMAMAQAQPVSGLYVGAGAGANFRMDSRDAGDIPLTPQAGWVAVGSVGWGFGNGLRVEVEGNYRDNANSGTVVTSNVTSTSGSLSSSLAAFGQNGRLSTYGVMVNVLYDIDRGWPIVPYVGVGLGVGWAEFQGFRQVFTTSASFGGTALGSATQSAAISDTSAQFAYQAILGAAYGLGPHVPGLALTAEYRFYGTLSPDWTLREGLAAPGFNASASGKVSATNYNHALLLGLRYNFGVRPPAPEPVSAPPAAPAPARSYLVFFDWNRADLTDRARQIIAEAAETARRAEITRIEVAGHADRSGTPAYNQALSRRRADAVAGELIRRGVAPEAISVEALGESRPLVPTADGVREAQNRRVEIVLR